MGKVSRVESSAKDQDELEPDNLNDSYLVHVAAGPA